VVDDDPMIRTLMARWLANEGYQVLAASDAGEALALVSALGARLAVVVTDIQMPGMNGMELANRVAQIEASLPFVFVSGCPPDASTLPGPLLTKPFPPEALTSLVGRILGLGTPRARAERLG
jgi:two-component system, cell cycle sensor histidine kinase and response regulator CckA